MEEVSDHRDQDHVGQCEFSDCEKSVTTCNLVHSKGMIKLPLIPVLLLTSNLRGRQKDKAHVEERTYEHRVITCCSRDVVIFRTSFCE